MHKATNRVNIVIEIKIEIFSEKRGFMKKNILFIAMTIALVIPAEVQSTAREEVAAICINIVKDVAMDCLLAYSISHLNILAHEAGHVLAAKACHKSYLEIGIGGQDRNPTYITIPWFNIKLKGFLPFSGYCLIPDSNTRTKDNSLKTMIISTAGPVFGIVASLTSLILLNKYASEKYEISRGICYVLGLGNITNAIPNGDSNDGQRFYDAYKKYIALRI